MVICMVYASVKGCRCGGTLSATSQMISFIQGDHDDVHATGELQLL